MGSLKSIQGCQGCGRVLGDKIVIIETREKAPRDFYIRQEDAEKHGYSRGCGGCSSWCRGLGRQPHNEACRNSMKEDAKVKNQAQKPKQIYRTK